MTEVAADIMKAARDIAHKLPTGSHIRSRSGITSIALAIHAERERCARVAEGIAEKHDSRVGDWIAA